MKRIALSALASVTLAVATLSASGVAQAQPKPEQLIKWRQSAYQTLGWSMARIKMNVDGTYNKDDVQKAANVIAALAGSGMGALFAPGTDTGKGWRDTNAKPEIWAAGSKVGELAGKFATEANEMAKVAATGDVALVKAQFGKLGATCKACHDDYRKE